MQSAQAPQSRSSLVSALWRYIAAVRDMEQTVLLPSLLREVAADETQKGSSGKDLYEHYLTLKALRNMAESSLSNPDGEADPGRRHQALSETLAPLLESDPEALLHFHLQGIFSVMESLSHRSQSVTSKYLEIVGIAN